jgi:hypothetical protein
MGQTHVRKTTIFDVVGNIAPPATLLLAKNWQILNMPHRKGKTKRKRKGR